MNIRVDDYSLATTKFGIGQPVLRNEDPKLVRGQGSYTDDVSLPGEVHMAMVRSSYAHGMLNGIDTEAARAMPGVLAIYTGADLAGLYAPLQCKLPFTNRDGSPMTKPLRESLATGRVRFVGDPVACVIAETAEQAEAAAEAIVVDVEPLPAVVEARDAVLADAPQLYDDAPGNLVLDYHFGDVEKADAAFASAAHVTKVHITNNRIVINAMEPRAALGAFDPATGRYTMYAPTQNVVGSRDGIAELMRVEPKHVHFIATNVGGSFGMKGAMFPEYACLLQAARELGRPVKWVDTRSTSFMSDHHGRDHEFTLELALDKDGHFLGVRANGVANMGAYLSPFGPLIPTFNIAKHLNSVYRTPVIVVDTKCGFTNTPSSTAYRGAGRPEGNYYMERLVETAAAEMGIDSVELRRRNHIQADQIPYKSPTGSTYDSGNFPAILDEALEKADRAGFAARKAESAKRGKLRGFGIGQFLEVTAPLTKELGGIRFEADGTVTLLTGSHDHGQGHWTPMAQIVSQRLGVPFDKIRLMQTDSDQLKTGSGTGGSKSLMSSGTAFVHASDKVVEKGKLIASHLLEAGVADIEFSAGRFGIAGTDRTIGIMEIAQRLAAGVTLPEGCPTELDADHVNDMGPPTYPNGCHICEVEIDPDTGVTEVVAYTMVGDFGTVVNPIIVDGQLHGGVMQGIGQCLMERTVFSDDGQLASGSFTDYAMPRADDAPLFVSFSRPEPATTNPLGAKGCGEAGCAGSLTSVMNAVVDALRPLGIAHIDMPATPSLVWKAIREARG